jgi:hypothetical protein
VADFCASRHTPTRKTKTNTYSSHLPKEIPDTKLSWRGFRSLLLQECVVGSLKITYDPAASAIYALIAEAWED